VESFATRQPSTREPGAPGTDSPPQRPCKHRSGQLHAIAARMDADKTHDPPASCEPGNSSRPWASKAREALIGARPAGTLDVSGATVRGSFKASGQAVFQQTKRRLAKQASGVPLTPPLRAFEAASFASPKRTLRQPISPATLSHLSSSEYVCQVV
jgi:hypothetical protein